MSANVKMKNVAEKAGVSTVTVSKALNNKPGVSEKVRLEIIKIAKDMGYRINMNAKSMKTGKTYNIGIIIPSYFFKRNNSFYMYYFRCLLEYLNNHNYYGLLHIVSSKERKKFELPRFCLEKSVDGIIFLGQITKEYILEVKKTGIPLVLSDFFENVDKTEAIISDNFYGSYELTNYIYEKGHKDIGFVGDIRATSSIQDRYLGFQKLILEKKLNFCDDWIVIDRDDQNNIFKEFALPKVMPTAFVCNSDEVAYLFIKYLKSKKIIVPKDCTVVCFDNTVYSELSSPKITALETNIDEMAFVTVEKIVSIINDNNVYSGSILIKGVLVEKESVSNIN